MLASVLHTVIIYAVVIFAMRLMGKRQLGELQPSELVTTFQPGADFIDCGAGNIELNRRLLPARLCGAAVWETGDGNPGWADPAGCTAASAHDAGRSDGSAARQGYF